MTDSGTEGYTPTTTHAEWGAGEPKLRISRDDERTEFLLDVDVVRIGSAAGNELRLADTDPVHATITHDQRDEYVLELHGEGERNASDNADGTHSAPSTETLRTGARFTAGPWTFVYHREEFADHGRPFGGRKGGEYDDQPLQPPRPDYAHDEAAAGPDDEAAPDGPAAETPGPDDSAKSSSEDTSEDDAR
ncbi:FHA domain-containing protein [Microbacterium sp. USHLN272]|uniref:FHA domain-containing protein n=1 Tax=Microbacterium sp. USHLN272 TaxID=3081287 RepID=UPI003015C599